MRSIAWYREEQKMERIDHLAISDHFLLSFGRKRSIWRESATIELKDNVVLKSQSEKNPWKV